MKLDIHKVCQQLDFWLGQNYYYYGREWVYKDIPPRIICEEYLEGEKEIGLVDYKIHCFDGNPELIVVDIDRFINHTRALYNLDWQRLPFTINFPQSAREISKPKQLEKMLEIARILSKDIPFIRVDLYHFNNRIVFGELTCCPLAGFPVFDPPEYDLIMGKRLKLPC